ncbi:helix-turn-helix domain-containing protein [Rhizobium sp.]
MSNKNLTVKEFADAVGYCDKTVRRKLAAEQIPGAYRIGGKGAHWKIPKESVDKVKGKP